MQVLFQPVSYWILFLFFVQLHSILSYFVFQFTHYGPAIFNIFIISSNRIVSLNSPVSQAAANVKRGGGHGANTFVLPPGAANGVTPLVIKYSVIAVGTTLGAVTEIKAIF